MWIYTEIANDDFNDSNFLAFFHMNEALFSKKGPTACDFGLNTYCDIGPLEAFGNVDDRRIAYLADTSFNSYLGRPNNLINGTPAQFPFQYWKDKGIGERVQGNPEGTGEVNPGFIGRAVHFEPTSFVDLPRKMNHEGEISKAKSAFTVEAAIRLSAILNKEQLPTQAYPAENSNYEGIIVRQKNSWSFGFEGGRLTFRAEISDGSEAYVQSQNPITLSSKSWIHVLATVGLNKETDRALTVNLYVDGQKVQTQFLKNRSAEMSSLLPLSLEEN